MAAPSRILLRSGPALCLAALAAMPAAAQRANENAVRSANDAFGTSVGNERVGIYSPFQARGFSPVQAGNVRLDGLYFDLQADLGERLIAGSNVRVGISAQGYPFAAPTGIADFTIRKPGDEAVLSTVTSWSSVGPRSITADAQLPIAEGIGVAAGAGVISDRLGQGGERMIVGGAMIPRIRPAEGVEIIPFVNWFSVSGSEAQPIYFTGGSYLPPRLERGVFWGPEWAQGETESLNYGLISNFRTGAWTLRGGMFRSELTQDRNYTELALGTTREGVADRFISIEGDRRNGSWSGELRASRALTEGDRLHNLHLSVRGRDQRRRYGGGQLVSLGRRPIFERVTDVAEPDFRVGPQTRDQVRQLSYGAGYDMRWRNVGEIGLSALRTDYRKDVQTPGGPLPPSSNETWLLNANASVHATSWLTFYGGYARGLEESPVAPPVALNRDEAPPAILTQQVDGGVRIILPRNLRLIAGLFDVSKPYFGLDTNRLFRQLGQVRHRGVELSVAGSPLPGLSIIAGMVFLDARVSGDAVRQGLVGSRPIGTFGRYVNAAVDYRLPFAPGLSVDVAYEATSDRIADRLNTFVIPERFVLSLGARYRFRIDDNPATFRIQAGNVTGTYGWNNLGEGFHYNGPRRYSASLIVDI